MSDLDDASELRAEWSLIRCPFDGEPVTLARAGGQLVERCPKCHAVFALALAVAEPVTEFEPREVT